MLFLASSSPNKMLPLKYVGADLRPIFNFASYEIIGQREAIEAKGKINVKSRWRRHPNLFIANTQMRTAG